MKNRVAIGMMFSLVGLFVAPLPAESPWLRHVIDHASQGADGARLFDANQDGLPDVVTPWEEGGVIRICLHPGFETVGEPWPAVTVGHVGSPEDAVLVDLDADGNVDVVSSCEGVVRSMFVHWAPRDPSHYGDATRWKTEPIPVVWKSQAWMYALPMQIDNRYGIDLMISSKGDQASVGWLESPENPRDLSAWKFHRLYSAGWVMSLISADVNHDGFEDVLITDRRGAGRGLLWLEHPARKIRRTPDVWPVHRVGGGEYEMMFMDVADLNGDRRLDIVAATQQSEILVFLRQNKNRKPRWTEHAIAAPFNLRKGKSAVMGDIDLDGIVDIVHSTEPNPGVRRPGVTWLQRASVDTFGNARLRPISDTAGIKFDLLQLVDLDGDGDLDVMTCEERDNLGLIWYENPTMP
ncbi:MAG: VCBS repeat-containing protein [Planctomycetota bacterium]|nr:VCBS repeat-containing protein [Planctomycetota bacterium]